MRGNGRTTKMLKRALELAVDHDIVPVMVPTKQVGDALTAQLMDHVFGLFEEGEHKKARAGARRIRFVPSCRAGDLVGLPEEPVLADHTWHESLAWVDRTRARIKATRAL